MAKNLKITVKNTQLAEALKKFKKNDPADAKKNGIKPAREESTAPTIQSEVQPVAQKEVQTPKERSFVETSQPEKTATFSSPAPTMPPVKENSFQAKEPLSPQGPNNPVSPSVNRPQQPVLGPKYPAQNRPLGPKPVSSTYPPKSPGQDRSLSSSHPNSYGDRQRPNRPSYSSRQDYNSSSPSRQIHPSSYQERQGNYSSQPRHSSYSSQPRQSFTPRQPNSETQRYVPSSARPQTGNSEDRRPAHVRSSSSSFDRSGPRPGYENRPAFGPRPYTPRPAGTSSGFSQNRPGMRRGPAPSGAPRFGATPIPKNIPSTKPVRVDESKHKPLLKDKDRSHKKPEIERGFDSRDRQGLRDENDEGWRPRRGRNGKARYLDSEEITRPKQLVIRLPITVKDLASEMKLKASELLSNLFMKGVVLTLNDYLDDETTVQLLGSDFECDITIDTSEEKRIKITDQTIRQEIEQTSPEELIYRSPVVAFMGHVDHGKTSLIDAIRKTNMVSHEAGAITQHIGAFKCHTNHGDITILDTPGHEAFSAMRSRGTEVTDIVVLVVAGDEGIKMQTVEAIEQAKAANVPIVVAINKCDKPGFDPDTVYRQLAENNLLPEAWGGQIITINCSALTGEGITSLLEMLALQAEILELKANPNTRARGTVIESQMHKGLGSETTVLVQNGTLHIGDAIVFAEHWGRVKTMHDEHDRPTTKAAPSTPVKITGLSGLPEAGSDFIVVKSEKEAREVSEKRANQRKHTALQTKRSGLENLLSQQMQKQEKKTLSVMLRADVQGSLEALKHSIEKIVSSKVEVNVVSTAVGEISESDIQLAAAMKCIIIGFHTQIESHAEPLIKALQVQVKMHDIIYHAVDDVKQLMTNLLDKVAQENDIGQAVIKAVFRSSQIGNIAGSQVSDGIIRRGCQIRVVRGQAVIWQGPLASLKKVKEDVKEVSKGHECGILLQGFNDFKEGDVLQAYEITYFTPEL